LLYVVAGRTVHIQVVYPNEVGRPLPTIDMPEQGCIRCHSDHVGISFKSGQERRFRKSCLPGASPGAVRPGGMRRILPRKYFRTAPVVVVVPGRAGQKPRGWTIVMFVDNINPHRPQLSIKICKALSLWIGARTRYNVNFGMFFF